MKIMLEIIITAIIMWALMSALYTWKEETNNNTLWNFLDYTLALPWIVVSAVLVIIAYPFVWLWHIFRNVIKPVSVECWNKAKIASYWKIGNWYFCIDRKARALCNKFFIVRVVEPNNHIEHYPTVEVHNEPSVPDGEFR